MFCASLPLQNTQTFFFGLRMGGLATVILLDGKSSRKVRGTGRSGQNGGSSAYPPPEPAGGAEPHGSSGGAEGPFPEPKPPALPLPLPLPRLTLLTLAVA